MRSQMYGPAPKWTTVGGWRVGVDQIRMRYSYLTVTDLHSKDAASGFARGESENGRDDRAFVWARDAIPGDVVGVSGTVGVTVYRASDGAVFGRGWLAMYPAVRPTIEVLSA